MIKIKKKKNSKDVGEIGNHKLLNLNKRIHLINMYIHLSENNF
jgi:hypothetical protein